MGPDPHSDIIEIHLILLRRDLKYHLSRKLEKIIIDYLIEVFFFENERMENLIKKRN